MDGNIYGNDMQMSICIEKQGHVSSIYGNFGGKAVGMHVYTIDR